jgi:hypothetical protein
MPPHPPDGGRRLLLLQERLKLFSDIFLSG